MHWIIFILAGLCEVAFAYCLGRAKGISGMEWYTWITAFGVFYILSVDWLNSTQRAEKPDHLVLLFNRERFSECIENIRQ